MKKNTIGIAIPAYNEERTINPLLESIYTQNIKKEVMSVCVADNASADHTKQKILAFRKNHPALRLTIVDQPIHGIAPTRKKALDMAAADNPNYLLNVDADCTLPSNLLAVSVPLLKKTPNAIVSFRLTFPKIFLLVLHVYYKPLKEVISRLTSLQEELLGPSVYTGCLLLPTPIYRSLYWDDVLDPIIPDDDFLLSRRLNALGTTFIRSPIEVSTSDRRFWGDMTDWIQHKHVKDFRSDSRDAFQKPTPQDIQKAINLRIEKATQRILQSLVEYMFLATQPESPYIKAKSLARKALRHLSLPANTFCLVSSEDKMNYYTTLTHKYSEIVKTYVTKRSLA